MPLKLNSSAGGSVTLDAASTASARTVTIPAVNGSVVTTADTGTVTPTMMTQKFTRVVLGNISANGQVYTPATWARVIRICWINISFTDGSAMIFQFGDGTNWQPTGYTSISTYVNASAANNTGGSGIGYGFHMILGAAAGKSWGQADFTQIDDTPTWNFSAQSTYWNGITGALQGEAWYNIFGVGAVTLTSTSYTQMRLVQNSGQFDGGYTSMQYWG